MNQEVKCGLCGSSMKLRQGKFGDFYGCTNYPTCKATKPASTENPSVPKEFKGYSKNLGKDELLQAVQELVSKAEERNQILQDLSNTLKENLGA